MPPNAPPSRRNTGTSGQQDNRVGRSIGTKPTSVLRHTESPTLRYLELREAVLGYRVTLSRDPHLGAEQLAEALGGRALARAWLREALAELEPWGKAS